MFKLKAVARHTRHSMPYGPPGMRMTTFEIKQPASSPMNEQLGKPGPCNALVSLGSVAILLSFFLTFNNSCDKKLVLWFQLNLAIYAFTALVNVLVICKCPIPLPVLLVITWVMLVSLLGAIALGTAAESYTNV